MAFFEHGDTISFTPEVTSLATEGTFTSCDVDCPSPFLDVGFLSLRDLDSLAEIGSSHHQRSEASWDCSAHQVPLRGLDDIYFPASSEVSLGNTVPLCSESDFLFFGGAFMPVDSPTGLPRLSELSPFSSATGLSLFPSFEGLYSSAYFDTLSSFACVDYMSAWPTNPANFPALASPTPSMVSGSGLAAGSRGNQSASPPALRLKRYSCPYPRCWRVWKSAQALSYASPHSEI